MTMRSVLDRAGLLAFLAAVLAATATAAQQPSSQPNAMQGFSQNRNEPVKINAMSLEVRDKSKVATYSGNVVLVQGDTTMRCKTLVVYYDGGPASGPSRPAASSAKSETPSPPGNQQIRRAVASGGVIVTQKDQTATGEKAVYDTTEDTVKLFPAPGGFVAVTQGQNIVRGQRSLTVYLATGVSHFDGGVESLFVPNAMKSDNKGENHPAPPARAHAPPRSHSPQGLY